MRHLRLFEDFEHSSEEYTQMMNKYNTLLNDKAENIKAHSMGYNGGYDIELEPEVTVWGTNDKLDGERSYTLYFTETGERKISRGNEVLVSVSIFNDGRRILVFKDSKLKLDDSEINKILRMVDDATDYIGGVDLPRVERELLSELRD